MIFYLLILVLFLKMEADYGRTYVLGGDELKLKLKKEISLAWDDCKLYFDSKKEITGSQLFDYAVLSAKKYGWDFGGEIAGHLIGHFPHEKLDNEDKTNIGFIYIIISIICSVEYTVIKFKVWYSFIVSTTCVSIYICCYTTVHRC